MPQFIIQIRENYDIPNILQTIPASEWEIILNYVSELLLKHNSNFSNITEEQIQKSIENKYDIDINELKRKLLAETTANKALNEQLNLQKELLRADFDNILQKQRELNDSNIKNQLEYQQKTFTEAAKAELEYKNATISALELSLNKRLYAHDEEINALKLNYEKKTALLETNLTHDLTKKHESQCQFLEESYKQRIEFSKKDIADRITSKYEAEKTAIENELQAQKQEMKKIIDNINNELLQYKERYAIQIDTEKKYYERELDNLREVISKLNDSNSKLEAEYKERLNKEFDNERKIYALQLANLQGDINKLNDSNSKLEAEYKERYTTQIDTERKYYEREVVNLRERIDQLIKENNNTDIITKDFFMSNLQQALNPSKSLSPVVIGQEGEDQIATYLLNKYIESIVERTEKEAHKGDIYFIWNTLKCMIEVKNKETLTKNDISKFVDNITSLSDQKRINCAIFISLKTNIIPKKTRESLQLEYINAIPVIYIYLDNNQILSCGITLLSKLLTIDTKSNDELTELKATFIEHYKHCEDDCKYLDRLIKEKTKELSSLSIRREAEEKLFKKLQLQYHKYLAVKTTEATIQAHVAEEKEALSHVAEEKEAYISVDQHYKNIVEFYKQQNFNVEDIAVKDKILTWHKVLTINHCFEILKFISVYKKRPKRDDLVLLINGKRILTQQEFGKLSAGDRKCTQQIVKFATTFYSIEQTNP